MASSFSILTDKFCKGHQKDKCKKYKCRRIYLVSEPKFFTEYLLAIEMKKTEILMNKPVCLRISILELSKILMYDFWCNHVKPKYVEKAELCYIDTDSFIAYIKTNDIYKDIAEDFETC